MSNTTKQPFFVGDTVKFDYTPIDGIKLSGESTIVHLIEGFAQFSGNAQTQGFFVPIEQCTLVKPYSLLWKDLEGRKVAVDAKYYEEIKEIIFLMGYHDMIPDMTFNVVVCDEQNSFDRSDTYLNNYHIIHASDFISANKVEEQITKETEVNSSNKCKYCGIAMTNNQVEESCYKNHKNHPDYKPEVENIRPTEPIPFNLERWKTGNYDVVTRTGLEVSQLTEFNNVRMQLVGVINDGLRDIDNWNDKGRYDYADKDSSNDLFIIQKSAAKEWVNIDPQALKTKEEAEAFQELNPKMKSFKINI